MIIKRGYRIQHSNKPNQHPRSREGSPSEFWTGMLGQMLSVLYRLVNRRLWMKTSKVRSDECIQIMVFQLILVIPDHLVLHMREPSKVASFTPEVVFTDLLPPNPYELRREREGPFKCD